MKPVVRNGTMGILAGAARPKIRYTRAKVVTKNTGSSIAQRYPKRFWPNRVRVSRKINAQTTWIWVKTEFIANGHYTFNDYLFEFLVGGVFQNASQLTIRVYDEKHLETQLVHSFPCIRQLGAFMHGDRLRVHDAAHGQI